MGLGILAQHSVVVLGTVSSLVMEHLGLLGLADSGHAGLFIALTGLDASTASEKVLGVVASPDERLDQLAAMSKSRQVVPATFQIAYLPGLSTEAGKGLGSRLLGGVRDCDALMMVVRADEGHAYRPRVFCPLVTLWGWLSQSLSQDKSLSEAVSRIVAHGVAAGCSALTGGYSKARQRFPEQTMVRMAKET